MKLVLFGDDFRPGILVNDTVVDASSAADGLRLHRPDDTMPQVIENWDRLRAAFERLAATGNGVARASVRLRAPIPRPQKLIMCFGNYREGTERERQPQDMFLKNPDGVIGDGDTVVLPPHQATIFHHEAELGVVIGKRSKDVPPDARALDAVFGYTCFIDVSGRGLGRPGQASRMGKSFDTFAPMGPCIVTADEIADPNQLRVRLWVDGQLRQDYNTSDMEYSVPEVVSFATGFMTLVPGDLIACGTNHQGLGPMQHGDVVMMEIEGVGRFSVNVNDPLRREWSREIDVEMAQRVRGA